MIKNVVKVKTKKSANKLYKFQILLKDEHDAFKVNTEIDDQENISENIPMLSRVSS